MWAQILLLYIFCIARAPNNHKLKILYTMLHVCSRSRIAWETNMHHVLNTAVNNRKQTFHNKGKQKDSSMKGQFKSIHFRCFFFFFFKSFVFVHQFFLPVKSSLKWWKRALIKRNWGMAGDLSSYANTRYVRLITRLFQKSPYTNTMLTVDLMFFFVGVSLLMLPSCFFLHSIQLILQRFSVGCTSHTY